MQIQPVKITNADPSALGLFGLAMVTLVASTQKLGLTSGVAFILPWAIFLGAFAQLFACINDSKRNNVFGTTAFGAFAFFWFAVGAGWMIEAGVFGSTLAAAVDHKQLGVAYIGYLIFSLFMTFGAMGTNKNLFIIFIFIDFLFIGLSAYSFEIAPETMKTVAGISELLIALASFYGCAGNVLNQHFGRSVIPLGKAIIPVTKK
ncbi:acetate uptake transporter [Paenibacillus sp. KN14-4R]|uniref:acetate uptake transporter n=1 Tax=Paenibacillus sp. KN14-4R TaxID=3445773 RepID=UPI003FA18435